MECGSEDELDELNFNNGYFTLQDDTIYKQNQPCAIIVSLGLSKVKIRSLDGKQTAVYSNKRFDCPLSKNLSFMAKMDEIPLFYAPDRDTWRKWLFENHDKSQGIWLVAFKKETGKSSVRYDESVEEALCFGWIDSAKRKIDNTSSKQLFTPRKLKSNWSALNKIRVENLINNGLMLPAGLVKIEYAKQYGFWDALNEVSEAIVPDDLSAAFNENPPAQTHWDNFSKSSRKGILEWILNAKAPETRAKRILETATMAAQNVKANQYVKKN